MAAVRAARSEGPQSPELRLAMQAKAWGTLPEAGGLLDQPAGLIKRMSAVLSAYETITSRRRAKDAIRWIDADPMRYDYYDWLKTLEENYGN